MFSDVFVVFLSFEERIFKNYSLIDYNMSKCHCDLNTNLRYLNYLFIILCLIFFFLTTYGAIVIDGRYLAVKHKIAFDFNSFSLNSFPFIV